MDTSRLPGYDAWEREVFGLLSEHLGVLFRVFSFYAKLSSVRTMTEPGAPAGSPLQGLALHSVEWLIFVKDCQLTSLKLETPQLIELLPQSADPSGAPAGAPLASFLSGLLNLAFWRSNAGLGGDARTATAGLARGERRLRPLPECITTALRDFVLPLARRDTSQRFRARCVARGPPAPGARPPPAGTPRPLPCLPFVCVQCRICII